MGGDQEIYRGRRPNRGQVKKELSNRINRLIRVSEARLIGADGQQVGIIPTREALQIAETEGLDLVEIAPNASPPVCKVMDYGKFQYKKSKKEKEAKKANKNYCQGN